VMLVCLVAAGGAAEAGATADASLKVWYTFDLADGSTIVDQSGSGHDGVLYGTASLEPGYHGSALAFNGIDNYILMGNHSQLQPADLTVAFWFKKVSSLAGQEGIIVWAKPDGRWDGNGWYLTIKDQFHETNRPVLLMVDGNTAAYVHDDVDLFYPLGEWVHVAVTLDSQSGEVAVYRNGAAQQVHLTGVPRITATADPKWLGFNSPAYNGGYLRGVVDDFRIYDTALSPEAIRELAGRGESIEDTSHTTARYLVPAETFPEALPEGGIALNCKPFALSQVRLLDGVYKDLMELNAQYLRDLDSDRLLHMFRVTAGLPSKAVPLGGWEAPHMEIRGHTMGHYLSACALLYASTGDLEIKAKADALIDELKKCQDAHGNGYLSAFPETHFDRLEAGQNVWVPWYTMHKIFAGLYDQYIHTGSETALDMLLKLTDWAGERTGKLTDGQMAALLNVEFGGMNEVLYNVYAITGDPKHLELAHRFDHRAILDPLASGRDLLAGLHANTQIPKVVGAARRYELTGDPWAHAAAKNFWDLVVLTRSYATGGNSANEHFGPANQLAFTLGNTNHETCNTYNMLRLTRHLFQWTGCITYADYYERALLNGILSTINPETGMKMYFVPMGTGYFKVFHTHDNSFYCCTGTGMESFAKLGDSIYFHQDRALYVNLFVPSLLDWPELEVRIEQQTRFPVEAGTTLVIHCQEPVEFALNIRIPSWAVNGVTVKYNGHELECDAQPGSYLQIEHTWHSQDTLEVQMPMSLHLAPLPDKPDRVALMYGPLVLCGLLGRDNMRIATTGVNVTIPNPGAERRSYLGIPEHEQDQVDQWLVPVPGEELTFRLRPDLGELVFKPFYQVYQERYGIYWDLGTPDETVIAEPQQDPVLWYRFDQPSEGRLVLDQSGSGLHGELVGGAAVKAAGPGLGYLELDGVSGCLRLPDGIVSNLEQATISTWVYLHADRAWARVFDFGTGTQVNMFLTPLAAGTPELRFAITTSGAAGESLFGRPARPATNQWVHLAVTIDKSKAVLYVDGGQAAVSNQIHTYLWELGKTTQNYLGRSQYPADPYLDGLIADFRIYSRVLSSDEIKAINQEFTLNRAEGGK
ncbi:MAG TPA: beta-L-arabinofuranosidase domain-containing protein, partial [Limnochordia bacterium]|nr:beta-L-arabinofuranosidase domain-containing protein [Limnochordia bacterium]